MKTLIASLLLILSIHGLAQASPFDTGPFGGVSSVDVGSNWFACEDVNQTPATPGSSDRLKFYCKNNGGTAQLYTLDYLGNELPIVTGTAYTTALAQSDTGWTHATGINKLTTITDNVGIGSTNPDE